MNGRINDASRSLDGDRDDALLMIIMVIGFFFVLQDAFLTRFYVHPRRESVPKVQHMKYAMDTLPIIVFMAMVMMGRR